MTMHEGNREQWIDVVVRDAVSVCRDTLLLELGCSHAKLPEYGAGAHVAVQCGREIVRHYSLTGPRTDPSVCRIGVKLEPQSRGGSQWIFDHASPGRILRISTPRNHFPLEVGAPGYLLLSGGIGATPIISMLYELRRLGIRTRWVHLCRTPEDLGFEAWLRELSSFHDVHVHIDSQAGTVYDVNAELGSSPADTEVYCCGPAPLMSTVQEFGRTAGCEKRYHFEFFSPPTETSVPPSGGDAEFEVIQHSTGRRIPVPSDKTMLAALREAGLQMKSECEYGVCGWCLVPVIDGEPCHFDSYLTSAERASNKVVLPCVSRCSGRTIVLDI